MTEKSTSHPSAFIWYIGENSLFGYVALQDLPALVGLSIPWVSPDWCVWGQKAREGASVRPGLMAWSRAGRINEFCTSCVFHAVGEGCVSLLLFNVMMGKPQLGLPALIKYKNSRLKDLHLFPAFDSTSCYLFINLKMCHLFLRNGPSTVRLCQSNPWGWELELSSSITCQESVIPSFGMIQNFILCFQRQLLAQNNDKNQAVFLLPNTAFCQFLWFSLFQRSMAQVSLWCLQARPGWGRDEDMDVDGRWWWEPQIPSNHGTSWGAFTELSSWDNFFRMVFKSISFQH